MCGWWSCPLKWKKEGSQDTCSREQIGYSGHCQLCRDAQLQQGILLENLEDRVYQGETSRSIYTRASQHRDDYVSNFTRDRKAKISWMWDHVQRHHEGRPGQDYRENFTFPLLADMQNVIFFTPSKL